MSNDSNELKKNEELCYIMVPTIILGVKDISFLMKGDMIMDKEKMNARELTEKELEMVSGGLGDGYYDEELGEYVCPGAMCLDCLLRGCNIPVGVADSEHPYFMCLSTGTSYQHH